MDCPYRIQLYYELFGNCSKTKESMQLWENPHAGILRGFIVKVYKGKTAERKRLKFF